MTVDDIEDFRALEPFFRVIEKGLAGLVDGGHFFDLLADDVVFEFIITVPGYPRRVAGREELIELYRRYHSTFFLDRCFDLRAHRGDDSTVTLEYASEGRAVATGPTLRQPVHFRGHGQGSQDRPLAGLSRPAARLRSARGGGVIAQEPDR
jgi:ketosteroid isomerase-like protein